MSGAEAISPAQLSVHQVAGVYVHVPFCLRKCAYCDFYSLSGQDVKAMERYAQTLLAEAGLWPSLRPRTVYFGGGTPTALPLELMEGLLEALVGKWDLSAVEEWTVEANPATVTPAYLAMLRRRGVNRLSFGAQSFLQEELRQLARLHKAGDIAQSVEMSRQAGFARVSLDLIYGIPGQTLADWDASLERSLELDLRHLSCYCLTYEKGTEMFQRKEAGGLVPASEALELQLLAHTRRRLAAAGLPAYEISNYAAPGAECRHNLVYWNQEDYLGFGPAAASHVGGQRWKNISRLTPWQEAIAAGSLPAVEAERLSGRQRAGELVFLQLRLSRGVNYADFLARSGLEARQLYGPLLQRLASSGLLAADETGFRLTQAGVCVADAVAAEFLAVPG